MHTYSVDIPDEYGRKYHEEIRERDAQRQMRNWQRDKANPSYTGDGWEGIFWSDEFNEQDSGQSEVDTEQQQ